MGVPKFFRWLSERYPLINQRYHSPTPKSTTAESGQEGGNHSNGSKTNDIDITANLSNPNDILGSATLAPEVDRLYIDMNGIIHGCSHNNNEDDGSGAEITEEQIFRNISFYLDRVIGDIVRPKHLVYMAIDGVAPRAKLNQQRSRRYRSGSGQEIEQNVYEAHLNTFAQQQREADEAEALEERYEEPNLQTGPFYEEYDPDAGPTNSSDLSRIKLAINESTKQNPGGQLLTEIEPGRYAGKFETHLGDGTETTSASATTFHSNAITPGTPFFQNCVDHLERFLRNKLASDPKWEHLTIIFSGPNVPGEGEHKIMDFMRKQKKRSDYDPNLRHCIMGQDGDLIMLGLVTHEPNLVLFRETVIFDAKRRRELVGMGVQAYIHNPNFEFLHMNVLRDYLAFDFETSNVVANSPFDLERTIDDFVFMTFFVGNDFLPSIPALDIADEAFDLLWYTYREQREKWNEESKSTGIDPYLTKAGTIVSGKRLETFLTEVGSFESPYYDNKKEQAQETNRRIRKSDKKFGMETLPSDDILQSKEDADRARFREMMMDKQDELNGIPSGSTFTPVLSSPESVQFEPSHHVEDDGLEPGLPARLGNILRKSFAPQGADGKISPSADAVVQLDDQDLKGRYYYDKFRFTPFDKKQHWALRKSYIEGLVWNLKYYWEGVPSWDWYYPYHYGPMLSDLRGIDEMLEEISFHGRLGEPLQPFEQLLSCMPPSQAHMLPEPYRWLMTSPKSPLREYYPKTFTVDMNGKRWPWEAVVLLPFIDADKLVGYSRRVTDDLLSAEELERNKEGSVVVLSHASIATTSNSFPNDAVRIEPLETTEWSFSPDGSLAFEPRLRPGISVPLPGLPTLRAAPIRSLWRRRLRIDVFGLKSNYKTACLEHSTAMPSLPPLATLGRSLIGSTIWINYPHLTEALVCAVSDGSHTIRGNGSEVKRWSKKEAMAWTAKRTKIVKDYEKGQGLTGTGGLIISPEQDITLSVRPFQRLRRIPGGSSAKTFAKHEIEVPVVTTLWAPPRRDPRLAGIPALLERDPYKYAGARRTISSKAQWAKLANVVPDMWSLKENAEECALADKMFKSTHMVGPTKSSNSDFFVTTNKEQPNGSVGERSRARSAFNCATMSGQFMCPHFQNTVESPGTERSKGLSSQIHDELQCVAGATKKRWTPRNHVSFNTAASSSSFGAHSKTSPNKGLKTNRQITISTIARPAISSTLRGRIFALSAAAAAVFLGMKAEASNAFPKRLAPHSSLTNHPQLSYDLRGGSDATSLFENELYDPERYVSPPVLQFDHGTTTLSFIFQGGAIVAVDSRASQGSFVGSKTVQKVLPINSHILGTMAGGAADCSYLMRKMMAEAQLHELQEDRRMSTARVSRVLSNILYANQGLSVGTMILGFDDGAETNGSTPKIFYVDNTGVRIPGDLFSAGSGSTFALAILDTERRYGMTEEEAINLGIKAIRYATFRDAYSGGFINVYLITREGWKKVFTEDVAITAEKFQKEQHP